MELRAVHLERGDRQDERRVNDSDVYQKMKELEDAYRKGLADLAEEFRTRTVLPACRENKYTFNDQWEFVISETGEAFGYSYFSPNWMFQIHKILRIHITLSNTSFGARVRPVTLEDLKGNVDGH